MLPSGRRAGWGGRDLDVAPTSAGLIRDPEEATSLSTSWFGHRCSSFSTGFESYRSTSVGWDGSPGGDHSSLPAQRTA